MDRAIDFIRSGEGCAIVYARCVRIGSHSNSDAHEQYRSEKELAEAKARDPFPIFKKTLIERGYLSEKDMSAIDAKAKAEFTDAAMPPTRAAHVQQG